MLKKISVVMLSTNEKAEFYLTRGKLSLPIYDHEPYRGEKDLGWIGQHLYFLSDEEIKEGDWQLEKGSNKIEQRIKGSYNNSHYKKIIATTDGSLTVKKETDYRFDLCLPQPSQSFLEKYVREFNNGNILKEVMVEYEQDYESCRTCSGFKSSCMDCDGKGIVYFEEQKLKTNPKDNTITIKRVKESWSREEVIKLIKSFPETFEGGHCTDEKMNKWIEQNL